jgi:hypothetical protein
LPIPPLQVRKIFAILHKEAVKIWNLSGQTVFWGQNCGFAAKMTLWLSQAFSYFLPKIAFPLQVFCISTAKITSALSSQIV